MLDGVDETLAFADGLVFAGGPDIDPDHYGAVASDVTAPLSPERDVAELALMRAALRAEVPVLGVCRGMQLLNVAYGGSLEQHLPDVVGHDGHRTRPGSFDLHPVRIAPDSRVGAILGTRATVSSGHHQGIGVVGDGLTVSARADDGSVEGLEDPARTFAIGVLWHPEEGDDRRLFSALVAAARVTGQAPETTRPGGSPESADET
jgi:putative glutamine amidotransferase